MAFAFLHWITKLGLQICPVNVPGQFRFWVEYLFEERHSLIAYSLNLCRPTMSIEDIFSFFYSDEIFYATRLCWIYNLFFSQYCHYQFYLTVLLYYVSFSLRLCFIGVPFISFLTSWGLGQLYYYFLVTVLINLCASVFYCTMVVLFNK